MKCHKNSNNWKYDTDDGNYLVLTRHLINLDITRNDSDWPLYFTPSCYLGPHVLILAVTKWISLHAILLLASPYMAVLSSPITAITQWIPLLLIYYP